MQESLSLDQQFCSWHRCVGSITEFETSVINTNKIICEIHTFHHKTVTSWIWFANLKTKNFLPTFQVCYSKVPVNGLMQFGSMQILKNVLFQIFLDDSGWVNSTIWNLKLKKQAKTWCDTFVTCLDNRDVSLLTWIPLSLKLLLKVLK